MRSTTCFPALFVTALLSFGNPSVLAQAPPIELPQIVLTAKHRETVTPPGATPTTRLTAVRSSNTSVATAQPFRNNQVEIVAVAPGKTNVEFFDGARGQKYIQPVWVQAANATGGGGAGYDPGKTQLTQVTMRVKTTHNVTVPGPGSHQLSSVVSSNPGVATARTNTANTIQVYAAALGDTWIDFTDNATGTTYQVHVWVTASGSSPAADPTAGGSELPAPTADELAIKPPSFAQRVDPCIVGAWVSESLASKYWNGGAGAVVFIDKMGKVIALYSGMSPLRGSDGGSKSIQGRTVAYIGTSTNGFHRVSIVRGDAVANITNPNGTVTNLRIDDGGPAVPSNGPYKCTTDKLTAGQEVYKRVSK